MQQRRLLAALASLSFLPLSLASPNYTIPALELRDASPFSFKPKRPKHCPPCFNCNLKNFECEQFSPCIESSGKCSCLEGFGGQNCSLPLCGSLSRGNEDRPIKRNKRKFCKCDDGWEGLNCNVCTKDDACNPMMPAGKDGVCYREGLVQTQNFQMCNITNEQILSQLDPERPQATFSCDAKKKECNFQFWIEGRESFYCYLDTCDWDIKVQDKRNVTRYECENMKCACKRGTMLCGKDGFVDIGDFLKEEIKGPATFKTISTKGGNVEDGSTFSEEAMNGLISRFFGDPYIKLQCNSGECLYKTQVPSYEKPVKKINTPLIAGVIAGCALLVVALVLLVFFQSRRAKRPGHGPVYLPESDDEAAKLMEGHKPATLHFENVSYNLNGKQILHGVQGGVRPGELLAIMGASGAGKTTFLDILARKNKRGISHGSCYVNGEKVRDEEFRSVIGFVDQDDTMLPTLTVHETILDSAMLRLPKDMTYGAKEQRAFDVEKQLGIFHIRDQIIGSEEDSSRGISGGERRRVGIACELVTSPSILFLDEPTSGLDAFNAFNVVECLVNLVKTYNRTVVFTIHQPRSNIVALFDQLIILAKGRAVYSGPFSSCQSYFDSIGYPCPAGFNIADYLVDLTMHASAERSTMDFLDAERSIKTRSSSIMAIKSMASASNISTNQGQSDSAETESLLRPSNKRRTSVKQQQDQQLFTRRKPEPSGSETPTSSRAADDLPLDGSRDASQGWLQLSKTSGDPPPQILEDPHQLPPEMNATGTDLDTLISSYNSSEIAASVQTDIRDTVASATHANGNGGDGGDGDIFGNGAVTSGRVKGYRKVGILGQFRILSIRTWRNIYRDPMLMLVHYAISIVLAVFLGYLYYGLTDDIPGFQNRLGLLFFILALFGFSTLTNLTLFATERFLFVRERAKGYYSPVSYFAAKVIFDIVPLRLVPPMILGAIVYPMTGLVAAWPEFWKFIVFLVLFNFAASAVCLFIGIVLKNGGLANLISSLVMLFSLLFSGFFLNHDSIPTTVLWLQNLSIFHYGFEGLIVNETRRLKLIQHEYGLDIEVPGSTILSSFGFDALAVTKDMVGLGVFTIVFICLAYFSMHVLLVERR